MVLAAAAVRVRAGGNPLFCRVREELETYVAPTRADAVLREALDLVGATPGEASLGHFLRALDLSLPSRLAPYCGPRDVSAICGAIEQLLDDLAVRYFPDCARS